MLQSAEYRYHNRYELEVCFNTLQLVVDRAEVYADRWAEGYGDILPEGVKGPFREKHAQLTSEIQGSTSRIGLRLLSVDSIRFK